VARRLRRCQAAGISVSVVNGITAALGAVTTLNVALTHRAHAQGVVFVTGHAKPGTDGVDWRALSSTAAQARLTLVIYMGIGGASHIQAGLLHRVARHTPVAVIQNATLPSQRHVTCSLGALHSTIEQEQLASPSVIVVGEVVRGLLALQSGMHLAGDNMRRSVAKLQLPRIWEHRMIGYVTLGTNDLAQAAAFYDALLSDIGAKRMWETQRGIAWGTAPDRPVLALMTPFDGQAASAGNGVMVGLDVGTPQAVNRMHSKALALGCKDEGAVGPRRRRLVLRLLS